MEVVAGDLREFLRKRIEWLRKQRPRNRAVQYELHVACEAFVHITELRPKEQRELRLVKKRRLA